MIKRRISDLSCNKKEFEKLKFVYEVALKSGGHFSSISFHNNNAQNARRNRSRKVTSLNSPYSKNVKTNIGKFFIMLVKKHFHNRSICHKIFNLNTLKLSHYCTMNIGNIIKQLEF